MTYTKNLGRVKGEQGDSWTPKIEDKTKYLKITWEKNGTVPSQKNINKYAFVLKFNDDGELYFEYENINNVDIPTQTTPVQIKGEQGIPGQIITKVLDTLPATGEEGTIYIVPNENNNSFHTSYVYDTEEEEFYQLDDLIKFENYYTKSESNNRYYTKSNINERLGNIEQAQLNILNTLDNTDI
jgi:hypothetical protein